MSQINRTLRHLHLAVPKLVPSSKSCMNDSQKTDFVEMRRRTKRPFPSPHGNIVAHKNQRTHETEPVRKYIIKDVCTNCRRDER